MNVFFWNARARNGHVEATLNHPFPAQVLLVNVPEPEFEGQTKTRLGSPGVRQDVLRVEYAMGLQFAVEALNLGGRVLVTCGAGQESEIPNFKASYLGRFPLVLADFWTSDHLSERSRSVDAFSGTRARGTLTLKRR